MVRACGIAAVVVGMILFWGDLPRVSGQVVSKDIIVYGGTSGGVMAAVQGSRMGKSVAMIVPGNHVGGMTSSGLGMVDVGNFKTVGGLSKVFFHRVWAYYQNDSAWKFEAKHPMNGQGVKAAACGQTMWLLEPSVGEMLFKGYLDEAKVEVYYGQRLDRTNGVTKDGAAIATIRMESGQIFSGKVFVDATYEGDLMAAAGVTSVTGREANSEFGETQNGVRKVLLASNKFQIDPYVIPGHAESGLLPRVHPFDAAEKAGDGDSGEQAYCYRMCLTNVAENRIMVEKPVGYDEKQYEMLLRLMAASKGLQFLKNSPVPNRKTDTNNVGGGLVSTDLIGGSWGYAQADYATRDKIAREHELWQRGLIWTLQNDPRVPAEIRTEYAAWGLAKDEFADNHNWPHELYIREARRMRGEYVMTEHDCLGETRAKDSIGLGSYAMDSHDIKYEVTVDGWVGLEGGHSEHLKGPYPISYRAITPKQGECTNLLVPVCLSATHAAYGSIRMEPVIMILGQSAGTAAAIAIDDRVAVQKVDYAKLSARLAADGQVLGWGTGGRTGR